MRFDRHLHLELCRIARELNSIFGIQITFEMLFYFVNISIMCYCLFQMLVQKVTSIYIWINIIYWIFILIMRIYVINHICESVRVKVKQFTHLLIEKYTYACFQFLFKIY